MTDHERSPVIRSVPPQEHLVGYASKPKRLREDAMLSEIIQSIGFQQETIEGLVGAVNGLEMEVRNLRAWKREREREKRGE